MVAGDVVGCALHAVGGAGVAVLEMPCREVALWHADGAFAFELDDQVFAVDVADAAG